jgi:hypothetical protein
MDGDEHKVQHLVRLRGHLKQPYRARRRKSCARQARSVGRTTPPEQTPRLKLAALTVTESARVRAVGGPLSTLLRLINLVGLALRTIDRNPTPAALRWPGATTSTSRTRCTSIPSSRESCMSAGGGSSGGVWRSGAGATLPSTRARRGTTVRLHRH